MERIVSFSTRDFDTAPSAIPAFPTWVRAVVIAITCGTASLALPSGPTSDSGLRPYHAPRGMFAPAAEPVSNQLAQLRSLVSDQGIVVVSDHLIAQAQRLLENLPAGVVQPRTAPSLDGEIGMSWVDGDHRLEAVLDTDDRLVWITKIDGKYAPGGDVSVLSEQEVFSFYSALDGFYGRV